MPESDTMELAAKVVAAFVSNNPLRKTELPALIQTIYGTLARLSGGTENPAPNEELKEPAVSIRKSITPEYLICHENSSEELASCGRPVIFIHNGAPAGAGWLLRGRQTIQVAEKALGCGFR